MSIKRRIVDAHHHLWDLDVCNYPWLMEKGVPRFFGDPEPIQRNYLVHEFRDDAAPYALAGSIHIQVGVAPGDELHETEWLDETANADGLPSAIVAFCDLSSPDAQQILDGHTRFGRVRGIRHIVGRATKEDAITGSDALLENPVWISNLHALVERNLSFDLQLIPQQIERAAAVMEQIPGLKVALCHSGSPWDQSRVGHLQWRAGLQRIAKNSDMYCKISGLSMFNHTWTVAQLRDVIEVCVEVFSPQRCMFGSNFPVDKLHKSYDEIWSAYEEVSGQYSDAEQRRLFADTATEFYRL